MKKFLFCTIFIGLLTYGASIMAEGDAINSNFNGRVFQNLNPNKKLHGLGSSIKWRFTSKRTKWPTNVPNEYEDIPPDVVRGEKIRVSFIGHATFLIQTEGLNIITDPVYSERCSPVSFVGPKRVANPGIAFDKLPKIDIVLVSHNHYDHMDIETLKNLVKRFHPKIITPLGNAAIIKSSMPDADVVELDWYNNTLVKGVKFCLEPAQHWSARGIFDKNKALWGSFIIDTSKGQIMFMGDTGYDQNMFKDTAKRFPNIRLSLIPIGAYEPRWFMEPVHMNPEEAIKAHVDLKSQRSIASHFITFQLSDEGYDKPLKDLEEAKKRMDISNFEALKIGEFKEL